MFCVGRTGETDWMSASQDLLDRLDQESRASSPSLPLGVYETSLIERRITDHDCDAVAAGVELGLIMWRPDGRFDTLDRPRPPRGRWWLIEKDGQTRRPCWEFVPQLAAYVELVRDHGYHRSRVLFDTPEVALQLDLAVLGDDASVVILGEAKKESVDLDKLERGLLNHLDDEPEPKSGDEPRQLAWRLWVTRAPYLWLIAPSDRRAFKVEYEPLRLTRLGELPSGEAVGLAEGPAEVMVPPRLT